VYFIGMAVAGEVGVNNIVAVEDGEGVEDGVGGGLWMKAAAV
jgi:hypothetical protein